MSKAIHRLCLYEHDSIVGSDAISDEQRQAIEEALACGVISRRGLFSNNTQPFVLSSDQDKWCLVSDYLVGADWLLQGRSYVQVLPKVDRGLARQYSKILDSDPVADIIEDSDVDSPDARAYDRAEQHLVTTPQVHYLKMLMTIVEDSHFDKDFKNLFHINYAVPPLPLRAEEDQLTPLLVVRFVQVLRRLVSKGLRKSYYTVNSNLSNKVKGKVLVSRHIKENVLKNNRTSVLCQYDNFGENTLENQFLKQALRFARRYVDSHAKLFGELLDDLRHVIRLVSPAFDGIDELSDICLLMHTTHHPFYGEYKEAIRVGKLILKRFGYTVSAIDAKEVVLTPPFWINMPALFEMYVCAMMRAHNPGLHRAIHYQFSTHGNQLDILISSDRFKAVVDTKYKLSYQHRHIHQDIRQVAGYARLKKVRRELEIQDGADEVVDCLIIYPDVEDGIDDFSVDAIWRAKREVPPYHRVWKLGVKIPLWMSGLKKAHS